MTSSYRSWAGPARVIALAIHAAVTAARAGDPVLFDEASIELRQVDAEQLATLLGTALQELLERTFPDGLDSDDAGQLLDDTCAAAGWYAGLDRDSLIRALTGALGVAELEGDPDANDVAVKTHGLLLIAHLVVVTDSDLPDLLNGAMGELHRAQTVELP